MVERGREGGEGGVEHVEGGTGGGWRRGGGGDWWGVVGWGGGGGVGKSEGAGEGGRGGILRTLRAINQHSPREVAEGKRDGISTPIKKRVTSLPICPWAPRNNTRTNPWLKKCVCDCVCVSVRPLRA